MASIASRILLTIVTVLIAVAIGLLLRRIVVRSLKKTFLDNWIVQTLGILVILPPLIIAAIASPLIISWDISLISKFWNNTPLHLLNVSSLIINLIETVLIIVFGVGIARTMMKVAVRGLGESRIDINIRTLIGRVLFITVLTIVTFWILTIWEVSIGFPVAAIGVITVAFTVAIQDILKDLVAGFYILMERPFYIGDQISIQNYTGKVEDVQLRATKLRLVSGEEVVIPNSQIFGGIVVNNTHYDERRATIIATLAQEDFVADKTPELIIKTLRELSSIISKPEPTVTVSGFTGTINGYTGSLSGYTGKTVTLTVRFWVTSSVQQSPASVTQAMHALRAALPCADLAVRESAGDV